MKQCYYKPLIFLLLLFACAKEHPTEWQPAAAYQVSQDEALQIALNFRSHPFLRNAAGISQSFVIEDRGQPCLYGFNYANSRGFVLIAADRREIPVLAFDSLSPFPADTLYPGIAEWVACRKAAIQELRAQQKAPSPWVARQWEAWIKGEVEGEKPLIDGGNCQERMISRIKGPLLATTWGQGCGYNIFCPIFRGNEDCNHAPTGCVATAVAQVMRYYCFPKNYSWEAMPDNEGSIETARLMWDVGRKIGTKYGRSESGALMSAVPPVLYVSFGYRYPGERYPFTSGKVENELDHWRPVLMDGSTQKPFLGLVSRTGHCWVCDGYQSHYFPCEGIEYLYLHMNWGWDSDGNGWYAYNNFTITDRNYKYSLKIITNIKP